MQKRYASINDVPIGEADCQLWAESFVF
jgi:nuclear transport factor 2 (NTF2) superfamily protein